MFAMNMNIDLEKLKEENEKHDNKKTRRRLAVGRAKAAKAAKKDAETLKEEE